MRIDDRELAVLPVGRGHLDIRRSWDGELAHVAGDDAVHAVDLRTGELRGTIETASSAEQRLPLGGGYELHVRGGLEVDGGFTSYMTAGHLWFTTSGTQEQLDAELPRLRAELDALALVPRTMRMSLGLPEGGIVRVHGEHRAPRMTTTSVRWPVVVGPAGVLVRGASTTSHGRGWDTAPRRPWLVQPDGTIEVLGFELALAPLCALPDGRWLLPGEDELWFDGRDGVLHILARTGPNVPLLVAGRPVRSSDVLRAIVPDLVAPHEPIDPWRAPCEAVGARVELDGGAALLAIELDPVGDAPGHVVVARLPLDHAGAVELVDVLAVPPGGALRIAP